ncbi:MAG: hypothetical protein NTW25_02475 [Candidatus Kapabacteria bacterium]|nr:hypothetical protein [Candidatus Kapabacteria bacterium]
MKNLVIAIIVLVIISFIDLYSVPHTTYKVVCAIISNKTCVTIPTP